MTHEKDSSEGKEQQLVLISVFQSVVIVVK